MRYGLLLDTEYCTGCKSCELACRNEKGLPLGQWGIKVCEVGPFAVDEEADDFVWNYQPLVTKLCNLCAGRVAQGEQPACVHHCLAAALQYGTLTELTAKMDAKGKQMCLMIP